jgi:hypothetical protein
MTEGRSGHLMTVSNEDDGAPASLNQLSEGLQHKAGFTHVAYCTGPAQFAYLLSALNIYGISLGQCTILPFPGSAQNDDLKKTLFKACAHLGMQTVDPASMPSPTLSDARRLYDSARSRPRVVHWYCRGVSYCRYALHHLRKTLPDIVFEYYDGFGSLIAALEQEKNRLSLSDANCIGDLRQLAVQRLMRPDRYFMPDDGLWKKYAPTEVQRRTDYIPLSVAQDKIRLVGEILDEIDGDEKTLEDSPGAVLLTGMLSEAGRFASLVDELNMYDDILGVVRSVFRTAPILVKTHPRTSTEKMQRLENICAKHNSVLHTRQQLIEYILDKSGRHDVAVIGSPSTALLSTIQFGYGRAFCPSQHLIASYAGHKYADDLRMTRNHELMEIAGVNMVDSLQQLRYLL